MYFCLGTNVALSFEVTWHVSPTMFARSPGTQDLGHVKVLLEELIKRSTFSCRWIFMHVTWGFLRDWHSCMLYRPTGAVFFAPLLEGGELQIIGANKQGPCSSLQYFWVWSLLTWLLSFLFFFLPCRTPAIEEWCSVWGHRVWDFVLCHTCVTSISFGTNE